GLGMPKALARAGAAVPSTLYARAGAMTAPWNPRSALHILAPLASGPQRFLDFISKVDHIVAVSQWISDVLRRNAVPVAKITLCRQGVDAPAQKRPTVRGGQAGPLRIAYFGRVDRPKGPDLLARALKLIPNAPVQVDIFAIRQNPGTDKAYDWLAAQAQQD